MLGVHWFVADVFTSRHRLLPSVEYLHVNVEGDSLRTGRLAQRAQQKQQYYALGGSVPMSFSERAYMSFHLISWDNAKSSIQLVAATTGFFPMLSTICRNLGHSFDSSIVVPLMRYTESTWLDSEVSLSSSRPARIEPVPARARYRRHLPPLTSTIDLYVSKPPCTDSVQ